MTPLDALWQQQGEDHPALFTSEIVLHKKERVEPKISQSGQEGGRERKMWFALTVLIRICGVMLCKANTAGSLIIITRTNSPC